MQLYLRVSVDQKNEVSIYFQWVSVIENYNIPGEKMLMGKNIFHSGGENNLRQDSLF